VSRMLDSSSSCCTSVAWKMTSNGEMGEMGANWTGNRRKIEVEGFRVEWWSGGGVRGANAASGVVGEEGRHSIKSQSCACSTVQW
jgi:hypothetical protein